MVNWTDDPWIGFACEMGEEFFRKHRETMPENPHNVWNENEISYFCFSFTLWAAQSKFKLKKSMDFTNRASQYDQNVNQAMNTSENIDGENSNKSNYNEYKKREQEYISLLMKGSSSLFSTITGSIFKKACKAFVSHACKRYIFSARDLVKIIHPWLIEKGMEFDQKIDFT